MKTLSIKSNGKEWLLCEVPVDATNIKIGNDKIIFDSTLQDPLGVGGDIVKIPEGNYSIVGTYTPSTGENTSSVPTELLKAETERAFPYKTNPRGDYMEFITTDETSNIRSVSPAKHRQWQESESKLMPSKLLVIEIK